MTDTTEAVIELDPETAAASHLAAVTERFGPRRPLLISVVDIVDIDPARLVAGQIGEEVRQTNAVVLDAVVLVANEQGGGRLDRMTLAIDAGELADLCRALIAGGIAAIVEPDDEPAEDDPARTHPGQYL